MMVEVRIIGNLESTTIDGEFIWFVKQKYREYKNKIRNKCKEAQSI